jgi:hypothetical protein
MPNRRGHPVGLTGALFVERSKASSRNTVSTRHAGRRRPYASPPDARFRGSDRSLAYELWPRVQAGGGFAVPKIGDASKLAVALDKV